MGEYTHRGHHIHNPRAENATCDGIILEGIKYNIENIIQSYHTNSNDRVNPRVLLRNIDTFLEYCQDTGVISRFDIQQRHDMWGHVIRVARNRQIFEIKLDDHLYEMRVPERNYRYQ